MSKAARTKQRYKKTYKPQMKLESFWANTSRDGQDAAVGAGSFDVEAGPSDQHPSHAESEADSDSEVVEEALPYSEFESDGMSCFSMGKLSRQGCEHKWYSPDVW